MLTAVNIALVAVIAVCIYVGYLSNLYEATFHLGRSYFALLIAFGLFRPISAVFERTGDVPPAYLRAGFFFVLWIGVMLSFNRLLSTVLRVNPTTIKTTSPADLPGRLLFGALNGVLIAAALSLALVVFPAMERYYFLRSARPVLDLDRHAVATALATSRIFSGSVPPSAEVLTDLERRAAQCWLDRRTDAILAAESRSPIERVKEVAGLMEQYGRRFPAEETTPYLDSLGAKVRQFCREGGVEPIPLELPGGGS